MVRAIPPQERSTVVKVNFPDHSSTKIIVNPDMKIGELLKVVARKRQYNEQEHYLRLPYSEAPCDVNILFFENSFVVIRMIYLSLFLYLLILLFDKK